MLDALGKTYRVYILEKQSHISYGLVINVPCKSCLVFFFLKLTYSS